MRTRVPGRDEGPTDTPPRTVARPDGALDSADPQFQVEAPALSLPEGGGAIKSIDETHTVNPANGTVSLSLPLPLTPARADSACLVNNFANQRPFDLNGAGAASYVEVLSTRRADRWTAREMDVTLPSGRGDWRYTGSPGMSAVCR
jgi:hypothetical protein